MKTNNKTKTEVINLEPVGIFADRKTISEAIEFAQSSNDIMTVTAVMVMFNTIAKNYYLVEKDNALSNEADFEIITEIK